MSRCRRRSPPWAAWFGIIALALNALVPIHIAFDLADAARPAAAHGGRHSTEHRVLALLSGHRHSHHHGDSNKSDQQRDTACAVCNALGALAGVTPPELAVLPIPNSAILPALPPPSGGKPAGAALVYRSRAPPIA